MKVLLLITSLLFGVSLTGISETPITSTDNQDKSVKMSVVDNDGSISVSWISMDEVAEIAMKSSTSDDRGGTCTIEFSDGSCSSTASNCEAAAIDFCECAEDEGHIVSEIERCN